MKIRTLFFALVCFFFFGQLNAQWLQTNGPDGGEINCMRRVGSEIWLGTPNGIYKSSNEGLSWQKSSLLYNLPVGDIYSTGDTIVIQYCQPVLLVSNWNHPADYKSISSFDGGISWSSPATIINNVTGFYANFLGKLKRCQAGMVYTFPGSASNASFISQGMGLSWTATVLPVNFMSVGVYVDIHRIVINAVDITSNTRYLLISEDLGQTWQNQGSIGFGYNWYISDSTLLYTTNLTSAPNSNYAIIHSNDIGLTWDTAFLFPAGVAADRYLGRGDTIFATDTYHGLTFISPDKGLTWQAGALPSDLFAISLDLNNGDKLHYDGGVVQRYLETYGISVPSISGFHGQEINSVRNCNNKLYCSSAENLYRSPDGGQTWSRVCWLNRFHMYDEIIDIISKHDTILCVNSKYLGRSFDDGLTWDTIPLPGPSSFQELNSIKFSGSRLYLGSNRFWYSDDVGQTWDTVVSLPYNVLSYEPAGYLEIHNDTLYTVTPSTNIYKFDEPNNQWINCLTVNQGGNTTNKMLYSFDSILFLTTEYIFAYSTDGGLSWITPANLGLPMHDEFYTYFPQSIQIYQGLWFGCIKNAGVYYSSDHGNNWNLLPGGIASFNPICLSILNGVLYAGAWDNGVWRRLGYFYTLGGTVYRDDNQNGLQDPGEPGMSGTNMISNPTGWVCNTDAAGNYNLFTDAIGDTLRPAIPQGFFTINPAWRITNGADTNQDFGIVPVPNIQDLSIDLTNVNIFRPGFTTLLNINTLNKGSVLQAPIVKFLLPSYLSFQSSVPMPATIIGDTIIWQLNNLGFLENYNIQLLVSTSTSMFVGDSVVCTAVVYPIPGDTLPQDNQFTLKRDVQGSYDPNDKTCEQGNIFTPSSISLGEEMVYTIRFQNTGNLATVFVRVIDTLSPFLDWSSMRVVAATQPLNWSIHGQGIVEFDFNPLALQPESVDELASIGFVKYALKCKPGAQLGSTINNTAYIYFDYNPPIQTNTTTTVIANIITTQISDPDQAGHNHKLIVYPNPANTYLNLEIDRPITETINAVFYDFSGRAVLQLPINDTKTKINTSELPTGFYVGSLVSQSGLKMGTFKIIISR